MTAEKSNLALRGRTAPSKHVTRLQSKSSVWQAHAMCRRTLGTTSLHLFFYNLIISESYLIQERADWGQVAELTRQHTKMQTLRQGFEETINYVSPKSVRDRR